MTLRDLMLRYKATVVGSRWAVLTPLLTTAVWSMIFSAGPSLDLAIPSLFYRDVKYLFEIAITGWMFTTFVVYPVSITPVIDAYRAVLLRGELPPPGPLLGATAVSVATSGLGSRPLHRDEFRFAESV
jgi:ABC-type polysaccharide/polyol phosphate export permease